jgi:hypothetical protein
LLLNSTNQALSPHVLVDARCVFTLPDRDFELDVESDKNSARSLIIQSSIESGEDIAKVGLVSQVASAEGKG